MESITLRRYGSKNIKTRRERERDGVTENVAAYIDKMAINLSELSRKCSMEYSVLYASLKDRGRKRELRADEFIRICKVLNADPMSFADEGRGQNSEVD